MSYIFLKMYPSLSSRLAPSPPPTPSLFFIRSHSSLIQDWTGSLGDSRRSCTTLPDHSRAAWMPVGWGRTVPPAAHLCLEGERIHRHFLQALVNLYLIRVAASCCNVSLRLDSLSGLSSVSTDCLLQAALIIRTMQCPMPNAQCPLAILSTEFIIIIIFSFILNFLFWAFRFVLTMLWISLLNQGKY